MGLDEHVDSRCDECNSPLVQLDGKWYCSECSDGGDFQLTPEKDDFAL